MDKHLNIEEIKFLEEQIEKAKTRLIEIREEEVKILKTMIKYQTGTPMRNEGIYRTVFLAERAEQQEAIIKGLQALLDFDMQI